MPLFLTVFSYTFLVYRLHSLRNVNIRLRNHTSTASNDLCSVLFTIVHFREKTDSIQPSRFCFLILSRKNGLHNKFGFLFFFRFLKVEFCPGELFY